jgi:GTPase SAR1 family protein
MSVTLGVDHYIDKRYIEGVETSVWLCDTGGQDRYRAMAPSYFRDADGIFLIFSLEKDESIRGLELWM